MLFTTTDINNNYCVVEMATSTPTVTFGTINGAIRPTLVSACAYG